MDSVKIGIIGLGTIGKGVVEAIVKNGKLIEQRTGVSIVIRGVCDNDKNALESVKELDCPIKTSSFEELINDKEIDIIVELIGGIDPAKNIILRALNSKKHVVTANKALLSVHWKEIFDAASKNGVFVDFEASVGGGIPIIRALKESFVGNKIKTIYGILNGTTNFILTKMAEKGCSFADALSLAQEKGIAESDPELDVSGKDSAHKLAILSLIGFGLEISPEDIFTEGIESIGPQDLSYAGAWGCSIKLLAIAKDTDKGLQLRVHPTLIRSSHLLSDINGVDNAIFIKGDFMEDALLFGKGAGKNPTSSSVVGDITQIAKHVSFSGKDAGFPYNFNYAGSSLKVSKMEELVIPFYLRFSVVDKPGVLSNLSSILAKNDISIASVTQEERKEGETVPLIILTHKASEGNMTKAINEIDKLDYVTDKTVVIRMEE